MKIKVEDYRKQSFRDKVYHIATQNGWNGDKKRNKIAFNFDYRCETKAISINGVPFDDCVAYFYLIEGNIKKPQAITYKEIKNLERTMKLSKLDNKGFSITKEVKKSRVKEQKATVYNFEVGDKCNFSGFGGSCPCVVIKKTPKTITVKSLNVMLKLNDVNGYGRVEEHIEGEYGFKRISSGEWYYPSEVIMNGYNQDYHFGKQEFEDGKIKVIEESSFEDITIYRLNKYGYYTNDHHSLSPDFEYSSYK